MKTLSKLLIAGVVGFAIYNELQKLDKPKVYYKKRLANGYNARTIPPFGIFIDEKHKGNQNLIDHELKHWEQYQKKGLVNFYLDYYSEFQQYGYDNMPMEIEARFIEDSYCKTNYTYCVRNGIAKTVVEPNFRS